MRRGSTIGRFVFSPFLVVLLSALAAMAVLTSKTVEHLYAERIQTGLLAQAVSNVVRNAVEAMEGTAAGARTLRVEGLRSHRLSVDGRRQGVALLRVTDAGPGVPADAIEHLFNPWQHLQVRHQLYQTDAGQF